MHKLFALLIVALFVTSALQAAGNTPWKYVYPNEELGNYPVVRNKLTLQQQADMGLRPFEMPKPFVGLNYNKTKDTFDPVTLPSGTLVLVDPNGVVRYKADCTNRLIAAKESVKRTEVLPVPATTGNELLGAKSDADTPVEGFLGGPITTVRGAARDAWHVVGRAGSLAGWSLLAVVGLLILPAIPVGLYFLGRRRGRQNP